MSLQQMYFGLSMIAALALVGGCSPQSNDLIEIERHDGSTLFLDTTTIHNENPVVTFETTLRSTKWRLGKPSELRTSMQIDCQKNTWRKLDGGLYENGRLSRSVQRKMSGVIPSKGYVKLLRDQVC